MRWDDLRTVIGAFFGLVGILLLVLGWMDGQVIVSGPNLNLRVGVLMVLFAALMLYWASRGDEASSH